MDMTMVDVTDVHVRVGDVATLIGADGDDRIDVSELAAHGRPAVPYEVLTGLARPVAAPLSSEATAMTRRAAIIVLDGVGIGAAPDAADYGDVGSDTLGNMSRAQSAGWTCQISSGSGSATLRRSRASLRRRRRRRGLGTRWSRARRGRTARPAIGRSPACTSRKPFPTYPHGFPAEVVEDFERRTGRAGDRQRRRERHGGHRRIRTGAPSGPGAWILYTSADSVFQVAAHEEVIPLEELYRGCEIAREMLVAAERRFSGHRAALRRRAGRVHANEEPARLSRSSRRRRPCSMP